MNNILKWKGYIIERAIDHYNGVTGVTIKIEFSGQPSLNGQKIKGEDYQKVLNFLPVSKEISIKINKKS